MEGGFEAGEILSFVSLVFDPLSRILCAKTRQKYRY